MQRNIEEGHEQVRLATRGSGIYPFGIYPPSVPLLSDPDDPEGHLLVDATGRPLVRTRLRVDDGVAGRTRLLRGVDAVDAAAQARIDLAGLRLATTDLAIADALMATGVPLHRVALDMIHDLADLPPPTPLPRGWTLAPGGWDDDLAAAVAEAYGSGHVDGPWTEKDTAVVAGMYEPGAALRPLVAATARVRDPAGRSAGHILCAGPVPWVDKGAWIMTFGLAHCARGLGVGRALLGHALCGAHEDGQPCLGLSVTEGNPARRLYDAAGFRVVGRLLSLRLPADASSLAVGVDRPLRQV